VITAENDSGSTPAMSEAIAGEIPGAELLIVPALKHMALVEAPGAFTDPLLDFLDRVLPNPMNRKPSD
jgi:pimeloyl-ACP methyl ester carboxylesterase